MAVWDFAAVSNQNLVRSLFKEKKLSHRYESALVPWSVVSSHVVRCFHAGQRLA
jgi:hypothetical protein